MYFRGTSLTFSTTWTAVVQTQLEKGHLEDSTVLGSHTALSLARAG